MEVKEALDEEQKIYVQYRKSIKKSMKKKKNNTNKVAPVWRTLNILSKHDLNMENIKYIDTIYFTINFFC